MGKTRWTKAKDKILSDNYVGHTISEISIMTGKSENAVACRAHIKGLSHNRQQFTHNEHYFDAIDSDEKAYILGLLASDGSIKHCDGHCMVQLRLSIKDKVLVEFVRNILSPDMEVKDYVQNSIGLVNGVFNCCKLDICSKYMVKSLEKYGIVPNKTGHFDWPYQLKREFYAPFILGYFDGDGSAGFRNDGWNTPYWEIYSTCRPFLENVRTVIYDSTQVSVEICPTKSNMLYTAGSKVLSIDKWLHECGLGMERKNLSHKNTPLAQSGVSVGG